MMPGKLPGFALASTFMLVVACNRPFEALFNTTPDREEVRSSLGHFVTPMVDSAMVHDMSIADVHFMPRTADFNDTGVTRLDRMAVYLQTYGGTVHYETLLADEALIDERLENLGQYLADVGCDMERVSVRAMLSGGRGMSARDAIKIMKKGTQVKKKGGGSTAMPFAAGGR